MKQPIYPLIYALFLFYLVCPNELYASEQVTDSCIIVLSKPKLVDVLLTAAVALRTQNVDPENTHVAELIPLIDLIIVKTNKAIVDQPLRPKEKIKFIYKILDEAKKRIDQKLVTYNWAVTLTFRISHFLTLSPLTVSDIRFAEFAPLMTDLEKLWSFINPFSDSSLSPVLHNTTSIYRALLSFPNFIYLPVFSMLGFNSMNKLTALDIFPLGMIAEGSYGNLDERFFDQESYTVHDLAHANLIGYSLRSVKIDRKKRKQIERDVLAKIEKTTGQDHELFSLWHYLVFHEYIVCIESAPILEAIPFYADHSLRFFIERLKNEPALREEVLSQFLKEQPYPQLLELLEKSKKLYLGYLSQVL